MKRMIAILSLSILLLVLAGCAEEVQTAKTPDTADLAKCLTDNGAKMYGASWCGACNAQKGLFADAFQYVDYIDCPENPDKCSEEGITAYPTWIVGGEKHVGVQSFDALASLTGCTSLE